MALNVLQVTPALNAGGVERTTIEIAQALTAAGHGAFVWSEGGRLEGELAAAGATLIRGPAASRNPFEVLGSNAAAIARVVREHRIDLIHARSRAPAWSARIAARRAGVAFVTTYHGIYNGRTAPKRAYNAVMASGDAVIANSAFTRDHVIATHRIDPGRVHVIHRGVDVAAFDRAAVPPERVAALAAAWGLDAHDPRPLAILPGRLTAWKGQALLIDALAILARGGVAVRALFVGDPQGRVAYAEGLDAQAAAVGLSGAVKRVGHCADMPAAFALADLVVTPSIEPEAFGRVAAEALAMGVPVVGADHGATPEIVRDRADGRLAAPGDAASLAEAIGWVLALDPAVRAGLMAESAARVRRLFTTEALQGATLNLYHAVLARAGRASAGGPSKEKA